jgi:hypothetical protein
MLTNVQTVSVWVRTVISRTEAIEAIEETEAIEAIEAIEVTEVTEQKNSLYK